MKSVNRLGVVVAAISALAVLLIFGIIIGIRALFNTPEPSLITSNQTPATTPEQLVAAIDSDNDGLADEIESIYRTDPHNPDTDGDATNDGDELLQLRDPITAGPDDTLTAINEAGEIDTSTYTGRYVATFSPDASQAEVLSSERLETFIEKERQALVPTAFTPQVQTTATTGAQAIETYLAAIASSHNQEIVSVTSEDITTALRTYLAERDRSALDTIVQDLINNLTTLQTIDAPQEVTPLHTQLLAASESLLENVKLLQGMTEDFVGGLIGAKNIEELGAEFNDIAEQITALETKYNLE